MTPRTEPSDKPAEKKAGKPDRDEIEKLKREILRAYWQRLRSDGVDYDKQKFLKEGDGCILNWEARQILDGALRIVKDTFVPRTEHKRIVGELRKEHRKECLSLMNPVGRFR